MDPAPLRWLRITLPMAAAVDSMQSFEYLLQRCCQWMSAEGVRMGYLPGSSRLVF